MEDFWTFICRAIRLFHTCRYDLYSLFCAPKHLLAPARTFVMFIFLTLYLINTFRSCAIVILCALGAIRRTRINAVRLLLVVGVDLEVGTRDARVIRSSLVALGSHSGRVITKATVISARYLHYRFASALTICNADLHALLSSARRSLISTDVDDDRQAWKIYRNDDNVAQLAVATSTSLGMDLGALGFLAYPRDFER